MDGPGHESMPALERAIATLAEDRAPASLRVRVALMRATVRRPQRRLAAVALACAVASALAVPLVLVGAGAGGAVPSVAQAVALSVRPAVAGVHEPPDGRVTLPRVRAAGLAFPYWADRFGWRAIGFRRDRLDGRTLTTMLYTRDGRRVAYTIVSGPALPGLAGARAVLRGGTRLDTASLGDWQVVTWLRRGHTCVLSGPGLARDELAALGAWRGGGAIAY